ncbi:MAG: 3-deoxy-manno-octulosonate cytidylyltransferase [Planctomycetes bacterium]|nr:3-deoxy-manno-octulosonate cytidylyltransferase [Planctomycetota bacterium]
MKAIAVIPARYASVRLPGKPLLRETGKFLIQHVYEQATKAATLSRVVVATDDQRIYDAVKSFGGEAAMTRADHPSGTDRVAEVAAGTDADVIVNVQGDEPELEPTSIDQLVQLMAANVDAPIGTLACPFATNSNPADPNVVKVVIDQRGRAMYFSRALIPFHRDAGGRVETPSNWLLHLGIYAYRRDFLMKLATLPPTQLEKTEKLEQLRVLEHGYPLVVGVIPRAAIGIDTPEDYAAFVGRHGSRS